MRPSLAFAFHALGRAILRGASWLTPAEQRCEWLREWQAELWHVRQSSAVDNTVSLREEREILTFCMGAIADARCLRLDRAVEQTRPAMMHGSAWRCLLWLTIPLAVSMSAAYLLPGAIAARHPERYRVRPDLILIQNARDIRNSPATIPVEQYRLWKSLRLRALDQFAFYRIEKEALSAGGRPSEDLRIALASANLFAVLGLPVESAVESSRTLEPRLVLSHEAWQRNFASDPQVINRMVRVGQRRARVVAVAPEGGWRLPGMVDGWLLEQDAAIPHGCAGYVVAHLTPAGQGEMWNGRVHITAYNADYSMDDFWGYSFDERSQGPWGIFLVTVLVAFLAVPALTSVSIGDYSFNSHPQTWRRDLARWAFMSGKIVLLLALTYYVSLDLGYGSSTQYSSSAASGQCVCSFFLFLFGLRWAIVDQRKRCPVCLRRVSHPAHVGMASMTFLAWNGTELICESGHTLQHVPGMQTSWFHEPRWIYLDTSWEFLFVGPSAG